MDAYAKRLVASVASAGFERNTAPSRNFESTPLSDCVGESGAAGLVVLKLITRGLMLLDAWYEVFGSDDSSSASESIETEASTVFD